MTQRASCSIMFEMTRRRTFRTRHCSTPSGGQSGSGRLALVSLLAIALALTGC
jgi:hypothetical protein